MRKRRMWLAAILIFGAALASHRGHAQSTPVRWNASETGAKGDGTADNTAAIQKALDAARDAGGGIVELPAGRFRVNGTLSIPGGVTLQGTFRVPPTATSKTQKLDGTFLLAYAGRGSRDGPPFIRLAGSNAAIAGLVVAYPDWKQTDVPPVPYPPCVLAEKAENVGIIDCCFLNPYEAIKLVHAARHLVRNVTGYPSKRGIYVDECYDIGHIENIHFWPFGVHYKHDDPYCLWVNTEGVAFELARTDWHYVSNTFCFGYGVGYKFSASKSGSTNGNFLGLGADSCRRAVLVEQAQGPGLLITNGEFVGRWGSVDSVCLEIDENVQGKVSLVNCSFWGPIDRCVWMRSPVGQFTASACHFVDWDNHAKGSPAIQLDAGKAIVQGCTFVRGKTHVLAGDKVRSAILTSNQAPGGFRVENHAGVRVQQLANEQDPLEATPEAMSHYRIEIGAPGDAQYLDQWHGPERTSRWSTAVSRLSLPVVAGQPYAVRIALTAAKQAISPDAGLYLDGKPIALLKLGEQTLVAELPGRAAGRVDLELRCRGWVPKDLSPGSTDDRTLGVQVRSVTMRAHDAGDKVFDANTGEWSSGEGKGTTDKHG